MKHQVTAEEESLWSLGTYYITGKDKHTGMENEVCSSDMILKSWAALELIHHN